MRGRRAGIALALVLLVGIAAALLTRRPGDPALYPPGPGEAGVTIHLVSHGYHAGLAVPREAMVAAAGDRGLGALVGLGTRFAGYPALEIGWGEERFYREVPTIGLATLWPVLRALFSPGNRAVLHVVGLTDPPRAMFPESDIVPIRLSAAGFEALLARLDATLAREADLPVELGTGLYGPSLFYRAEGAFSLLQVCNHWAAGLLDAAGVPTAPLLATLPDGLILDLRWRAGLEALPR